MTNSYLIKTLFVIDISITILKTIKNTIQQQTKPNQTKLLTTTEMASNGCVISDEKMAYALVKNVKNSKNDKNIKKQEKKIKKQNSANIKKNLEEVFPNITRASDGFSRMNQKDSNPMKSPEKIKEFLYKTTPCNNILTGPCQSGKNCTFAHSLQELVIQECCFRGYCTKQDKCKFLHPGQTKDEIIAWFKYDEFFETAVYTEPPTTENSTSYEDVFPNMAKSPPQNQKLIEWAPVIEEKETKKEIENDLRKKINEIENAISQIQSPIQNVENNDEQKKKTRKVAPKISIPIDYPKEKTLKLLTLILESGITNIEMSVSM